MKKEETALEYLLRRREEIKNKQRLGPEYEQSLEGKLAALNTIDECIEAEKVGIAKKMASNIKTILEGGSEQEVVPMITKATFNFRRVKK
jgi:hypothetical protein